MNGERLVGTMNAITAFFVGLMIGAFFGTWWVYFFRRRIWGFDPDEVSRERGLRR